MSYNDTSSDDSGVFTFKWNMKINMLHKVCFVLKKTKVSSSVINEGWQIIMSNHCVLRWYGAVLQESNCGGGVYQCVAIATAQDSGGWSGSVRHVKHKPNRWRIWMFTFCEGLVRIFLNACQKEKKDCVCLLVFGFQYFLWLWVCFRYVTFLCGDITAAQKSLC